MFHHALPVPCVRAGAEKADCGGNPGLSWYGACSEGWVGGVIGVVARAAWKQLITESRDCDYSLANLRCSCNTVLPLALEQASHVDHLTIWFTDASALGLLSNFTLVQDLKLSLRSTSTLPAEHLAICGLKRLRVNTEARRPSPEQSLLIYNGGESEPRQKPSLAGGFLA
ncbi:hypothetical protein GH733_013686 [Mirounga leonina]|nr:hypothetical protein GH733_013686 [Mirounga leonina]